MSVLKPLVAALFAASIVVPAGAATYQFRLAAKGVTASSQAALGSLTPVSAFMDIATDRSASAVVQLRNTGSTALRITDIVAAGEQVIGEFSQSDDCGESLGVNAECSITVNFSPAATGPRTGRLTVTTDSKTQLPLSLGLSGTGATPPMSAAFGALSPAAAFDSVLVGTSATATVSLANTGRAPVSVQSVLASGNQATGEFAQTNNCGSSIAANTQCSITITFQPTVSGARSGNLTVATNIAGQPALALSLSGIGLKPAPMAAPLYVVLTSGGSYSLPGNAATVTAWAIGGGGGGAGTPAMDGAAGGGGGAGGIGVSTFTVSGSQVLTYTVGVGGSGGSGASNGSPGTSSTLTVGGSSIAGLGGGSGIYNTAAYGIGGGFSGASGIAGGNGTYSTGDSGGGGGGAIGSAPAALRVGGTSPGFPGAQSINYAGLFAALAGAGLDPVGPGAAGSASGGAGNTNHGGAATGFGSGGGGAGWYGGNGGAGKFGGGGGGAAGYTAIRTGGTGGQGAIVLKIQ